MSEDLGRLLKRQQNYILKMSTGQFYTYLTKGKRIGKMSCEKCLQGGDKSYEADVLGESLWQYEE